MARPLVARSLATWLGHESHAQSKGRRNEAHGVRGRSRTSRRRPAGRCCRYRSRSDASAWVLWQNVGSRLEAMGIQAHGPPSPPVRVLSLRRGVPLGRITIRWSRRSALTEGPLKKRDETAPASPAPVVSVVCKVEPGSKAVTSPRHSRRRRSTPESCGGRGGRRPGVRSPSRIRTSRGARARIPKNPCPWLPWGMSAPRASGRRLGTVHARKKGVRRCLAAPGSSFLMAVIL